MINLGDVNFSLGADTRALQSSITALQNFGRQVDMASSIGGRAANQISAAMRRQEQATVNATNKILGMNNAMRKIEGSDRFISQNNAALKAFADYMTAGTRSALEFQRAQERLKASLSNSQRGFRDHSVAVRASIGDNKNLVAGLQNVASTALLVAGPLSGIATRIVSLTTVIKRGGIEVAAFVAGLAAGGYIIQRFGGQILEAGAQMKGYQATFKAITGSTTEGAKDLAVAFDIARQAGTSIESTIAPFAKFEAATEGTILQGQKTREIFEGVAKASSVLNLGVEQTGGVFRALEQMVSKGTVQSEELRGQLGDRLPGAFQIAARAMGVTTMALSDMLKKGQVVSTDFLPKFVEELKKSLNIDAGPILTYSAAVNNLGTAWFQLKVNLDQQFQISDRVMALYIKLTGVLDYLRTNMQTVVLVATALAGALLGMIAPGILSGFVSLIGMIGNMSKAMIGLNAIMMLNPFGLLGTAIVYSTLALAGALTALYQYSDQIQVLAGHMGTLYDYMVTIWDDIKALTSDSVQQFADELKQAHEDIKAAFDFGDLDIAQFFKQSFEDAARDMNDFLNDCERIGQSIGQVFSAIGPIIAGGLIDAMNSMVSIIVAGLNKVVGAASSAINALSSLSTSMGGMDFSIDPSKWKVSYEEVENKYAAAAANSKAIIDKIWAKPQTDYVGLGAKNAKDYVSGVIQSADAKALERWKDKRDNEVNPYIEEQKNAAARAARNKAAIAQFGDDAAGGGGGKGKKGRKKGGGGGAGKAEREAEKQLQAMTKINDEIERTKEEIDALGGTQAGLESLTEKFKRDKQVEKFGNAMRKAGIDTEFIKDKTAELNTLLEQKDLLERQRAGLVEFRDSLVKGFDDVGDAIVDNMMSGKDAFEGLADIAKTVAADITKTFVNLAIMNPLKNAIFGLNEPTMGGSSGGGGIGGFFGGLGSLLGMGGGGGGDPWAGLRMRNGGVSGGFTTLKRAANGLVTSPTNMMTSMGAVQAGEAGTEAIMPLQKNGSGELGIRADGIGGAGGNTVIVNVYAPDGSKVEKKQSNSGDTDFVDIFITQAKNAVMGDIAAGGTGINKAMEGRYGLRASSGLATKG